MQAEQWGLKGRGTPSKWIRAEEEVLPSSSQSFYYANVYHKCSRRDPACGSAHL